ncbi:MAG: DUF2914 domain-containing protein [Spirosomaceae bacterium]|nr:DUF2914 domain-containing protein [Spirosomataceae bacterium]
MKRAIARYKNSAFRSFVKKHEKYAAFAFFVGGFIFDSFTLGRIDRLYDLVVLCLYMTALTVTLYLFNLADDGKWKNTWLERYELYFPLTIQFFFGGLSSAFVIYFSRSVSLSRTMSFFIILVVLLGANEFLKKRISNKYLQFGLYFFVSFTFFTFIIPVFVKEISTQIFIISGLISLVLTLLFILFIYRISPSTRAEIQKRRIIGLILLIYTTINIFYYFNLIPPVPLALQQGIAAHNVEKIGDKYLVSYETNERYIFWREHNTKFYYKSGEKVFAFTSVFAPTDIDKAIFHRWKWFNTKKGTWETADEIGYKIIGGRDDGYRGYSYKSNVKPGLWEVDVITEEGMLLGIIDFEIINSNTRPENLVVEEF